MLKKIITFILLVLIYTDAGAEYRYMNLSTLVCMADYAAVGTIVKLDKDYFYLKVEEQALNNIDLDTLKIQRFEDWNCGRRYGKYQLGQRELVFFGKSNYVVDDYELLGYGGGGEFELSIRNDSIFYHSSYEKLKPYNLKDFLIALRDFDKIKRMTKEISIPLSKQEQSLFASKSELHKLFIECKSYKNGREFEIPLGGYMVNLESNYLYQDYENKIFITNVNMDSIMLYVEDAEVWKQEQYFVVKPKDGWTRRWLNVYAKNDTGRKKVLLNQIFQIIEVPEPRIYIGGYYCDSVYRYDAYPTAAHYLDEMHKDEHLNYELLSYTYEIKSKGQTETFKMKSERGTNEFKKRLHDLKPGDRITVKDIYVLCPNNKVKQIKGRTVYVGKSE